ncbi:MAG: type II toxin-antitoxin system RelE/ParE family toxin [Proteobacteria bacterium]|nr:type II toxin-antitoxin system RelE/ParE family toxin [Pseudomonadota bacterium]
MIYRLVVRRQAQEDIRTAAHWYAGQRVGLGRAFVQQIDRVLDRILVNPEHYPVVHQEIRRAIARRFPYGVFYRIDGSDILVFAVLDLRRDPAAWRDRAP